MSCILTDLWLMESNQLPISTSVKDPLRCDEVQVMEQLVEDSRSDPMVDPGSLYTALDSTNHEIRVLDILPGLPGTPISCSVRHTRLLRPDTVAYTSLSYVWGRADITAPITFNGISFPVTLNLASALDHVRSETEIVTFWADALCINQKDNLEKSAQVSMMGDIYRGGTGTSIWLGEERDGSDLAMDIIAQMDGEDLGSEKNQLDGDGLKAIANLQARDWWSRVWVIQEALLSKAPVIQCGNKSLPIDAFIRLDDIRRGWHRSTCQYSDIRGSLIPGNPFASILTDFPEEIEKIKTGNPSSLQSWITSTEDFHATDPRDKIYALLSLSPPSQTANIIPDYSAPVADVYAAVTARCIIRYQDLTMLHFDADNKSEEHQLPSWVRDYSSSGLLGQRQSYVGLSPSEYAASGRDCWGRRKIFIDNIFSNDFRQLRSRGMIIDSVVYAGRNEKLARYTGVDPQERLANVKERSARTLANVKIWEEKVNELRESPYDLAEGIDVAFWRTLMANRRFGNWAPLPADMKENVYFETWMGRLPLPDSEVETQPPGADLDEAKRLYVKPFTDACITWSHGRSFIITLKGYIGLAPLNTEIGDTVTVLEGGSVPFVLRALDEGGYKFIGESYVHGIMEGEALLGKRTSDVQVLVMNQPKNREPTFHLAGSHFTSPKGLKGVIPEHASITVISSCTEPLQVRHVYLDRPLLVTNRTLHDQRIPPTKVQINNSTSAEISPASEMTPERSPDHYQDPKS
ncbi:HET-domain-containing protein [Cadophora sp. DSE1049]|nr:HET-domain-containing protein [Cadophora sp. DSE1049]